MRLISYINKIVLFLSSILLCCNSFANEDLLSQGRQLQRDGNYDQAIAVFKECLSAPEVSAGINEQQMFVYTEALVQLMNSFQSKGEPEECIAVLNELFDSSDVLQKYCARDFYSVLAYALSRTENMKGAEESMLKVDEEVLEVKSAIAEGSFEHIEEEFGDLLLSVVNAARLSGVDPELALTKACEKYLRRFASVEKQSLDLGRKINENSRDELLSYWKKAKKSVT